MLKDLLSLGDSHSKLREVIYKSPEIWTSDLLFPIGDDRITDKFIQRIIPRITRHYGIMELKMIDLPLTWFGYLLIFDQFAHSVSRIEIKATIEQLNQLSHHLSIFAGNLAMLQQNNKIPITFRQYAFDDEEEFSTALIDSNYLGQSTLHNLNDQFASMELDDPPFERLNDFNIIVSGGSGGSENVVNQLKLIASFLSGQPISTNSDSQNSNSITPRSPITTTAIYPTLSSIHSNNKRSRDIMDESSSYGSKNSPSQSNNKHIKYDYNQQNAYYQPHQQQQYSRQYPHHHFHHHDHNNNHHQEYHHHLSQQQQHQESQESQQPAVKRLSSYSSSFA